MATATQPEIAFATFETMFHTMSELAQVAKLVADRAGRIVLVSRPAEDLFGYSPGELVGRPLEVLIPERLRGEHPAQRARFFEHPEARPMGAGRELFGLRRDGTEFPIEISLNSLSTDRGCFALAVIVDITARRRLEQQFLLAVEASPAAMVMVDSEGRIVFVNGETEKLFGHRREQLVGELIELLVPKQLQEAHPSLRAQFFESPGTRRMGTGRDLSGCRRDGSEFPVEIGLNPVHTEDGMFVLAAIADITERKLAEVRIRQANEELERRNRELDQFASMASHDLQEPLRRVVACCQALAEDYGDKLGDDARQWIGFAIDSATRMRRLIRGLLEYARVGWHVEDIRPTDAGAACEAAESNLAMAAQECGATIRRTPLPRVLANELQLVQLFQNLIGNSLKYRGTSPPVIEVGAEPWDGRWRFHVRDNGLGIAPEHHERVFQVLQRLHRDDEIPGTGIGLATCRKVVEHLGGRLWVESQLGSGSCFYFTLPGAEESPA